MFAHWESKCAAMGSQTRSQDAIAIRNDASTASRFKKCFGDIGLVVCEDALRQVDSPDT